jgi:hypothetical protein
MMPSTDLTQIFGRLIPLKRYRNKFNILTNEPIRFVTKVLKKKFSTNRSQITVLNLTRQDVADAEEMLLLLLLLAEGCGNNNRSTQYSKCQLSIYLNGSLQKF